MARVVCTSMAERGARTDGLELVGGRPWRHSPPRKDRLVDWDCEVEAVPSFASLANLSRIGLTRLGREEDQPWARSRVESFPALCSRLGLEVRLPTR